MSSRSSKLIQGRATACLNSSNCNNVRIYDSPVVEGTTLVSIRWNLDNLNDSVLCKFITSADWAWEQETEDGDMLIRLGFIDWWEQ